MSICDVVDEALRALPDRPGIYLFRGADDALLYVGKAKSLRKRGGSYLREQPDYRIRRMLSEALRVDWVITDTEADALNLENNWIKTKKPRYNIRLRDDKTYPYLKLTLADDFPRIAFTRRIRKDGAEYFGPFLPAGLARKAIKLVQKLFQLRICRIEIDGRLVRPCLYHDMHRCLGPCVASLTTKAAYDQAVQSARLFLQGRNDELVRDLKKRMFVASEEMEFEEAARLRDLIVEVDEIGARRKVSSVLGEDTDIYGVHTAGGNAAVTLLVMRGGQILDRRELFWEGQDQVDPAVLLSEVLPQLYDTNTFIPKEIHLPFPIEDPEVFEDWLSERKGERVYLRLPSRGTKADRVELAGRNAEMAFKRRFRSEGRGSLAARALAKHLDLAEPPRRIEGFDISHFQGAETVASMVVWEEGRMRKGQYRIFNIKGLTGPDDFTSMNQVVERRYRRQLEEVGSMPDLILIDGGRGQLNAAIAALALLGVEETPIVGLAKREEEIYLPQVPEPLRLQRSDPGLQLLQEIRDESHRFAVSRHRGKRQAGALRSKLDAVRGIGPKRRKELLKRFGSLTGVLDASRQQLEDALGKKIGAELFLQLQELPGTLPAVLPADLAAEAAAPALAEAEAAEKEPDLLVTRTAPTI